MSNSFLPGSCKLKVVFKSPSRLGDFFRFMDRVPMRCRSFIIYKFTCSKCNLAYYGKTFRHYLVRSLEHLGVSIHTGKKYTFNSKNSNNTAVLKHIHECKCEASLDDFQIIGSASNDYHLKIKESLLIQKDNPIINLSVKSTPLYLF